MSRSVKRNSSKAIAAAARAEFSTHGFSGARVDRIARAAGVNKQLIFYYYRSKAGLYETVVSADAEELARATANLADGHQPTSQDLRRVYSALCEALAERPHLVRLLLGDRTSDAARDLTDAALEACAAPLSQLISRGQGLGYFRDDADPDRVARHAVVLAVGYLAIDRGRAGETARTDWVPSVAELLSRGLAW